MQSHAIDDQIHGDDLRISDNESVPAGIGRSPFGGRSEVVGVS